MDVSSILAQFWGWYLIIFFVILSFNPKRIKQIFDDLEDQKFLILASFLAIIIGLINILVHNIWEPNYKLVITLIGWIALIKGVLLFTFPNQFISWLKVSNIKFVQVVYILLLLVGLFLINEAYLIIPY
jgi:hypothetical protein